MGGSVYVRKSSNFTLNTRGIDRIAEFTRRRMNAEDWDACKVAYDPLESLQSLFLDELSSKSLRIFFVATKLACDDYERDFCNGEHCEWWREIISAIEADPRLSDGSFNT